MENLCLSFILALFINFVFILAQIPQNMRIFEIRNDFKISFHEYTVFKNEKFAFKFRQARGTPNNWYHFNESISNKIKFINRTYYSFADEYNEQTFIITDPLTNSNTIYKPQPILGGSSDMYEIYQALEVTNVDKPDISHLRYSSSFLADNNDIQVNIKIWICDEIYKEQCIENETSKCFYDLNNKTCYSRPLCDKIEQEKFSEILCNNAVSYTPSVSKCIYNKSEDNNSNIQGKCVVKNLCINTLTEKECNSALTISPETSKCIYNKEENKCQIKELCELEENPSKIKCEGILTSNPS